MNKTKTMGDISSNTKYFFPDTEIDVYKTFGIRSEYGSAQFSAYIAELQKANTEIREGRRAALNLMEDALLSKEALQKSEQKYRTLFESMDQGFAECELIRDEQGTVTDHRLIEINPAFERLTGIDSKQARGRPAREVFPGLDVVWSKTFETIVNEGIPQRFEHDESSMGKWFEVFVYPKGGDSFIELYYEITERKKSELALRESEDRKAFLLKLSDALNPLSDAVSIEEKATAIAMGYFNSDRCYYCEFCGDEAIIRRDAARDHLSSIANVYQWKDSPLFKAVVDAGEPVIVNDICSNNWVDHPLREMCLQLQVVSIMNIPVVKNGTVVGALCVVQSTPRDWSALEISLAAEVGQRIWGAMEKARSEEIMNADLRDAQLLVGLSERLISEHDMEVIYNEVLDAAIAITVGNAGTVQIYDEDSKKLKTFASKGFSKKVREYFTWVDAGSNTSCGLALLTGKRTFVNFDDDIPDPHGTLKMHVDDGYLSAQSTPLITRWGKPIGMVSTHWHKHRHRPVERELRFLDLLARQAADLIEQTQSEKALLNSGIQLKNINTILEQQLVENKALVKKKDEFISIASHELRTPLTPLNIGLEMLIEMYANCNDDFLNKTLHTLGKQTKKLISLLNNLLDASHTDIHHLNYNMLQFDIAQMVYDATKIMQTTTSHKLIIEGTKSCLIYGDKERLEQVYINLLTNAIKYSPNADRVLINIEYDERSVMIAIKDFGIGISDEYRAKIFERFYRVEDEKGKGFGGFGIGLYIAAEIVSHHNGTIHVESTKDCGSAFCISLPLLKKERYLSNAAVL